MSSKLKKLMIAGGGTGGHILPGVAIADEWKKKYANSEVIFVGAKGALEEKIIPKAGYPLKLLRVKGFNQVSFYNKLKSFFVLPFSVLQSIFILLKERPTWVLGVGGYASVPILFVASTFGRILGIKSAVLEPNAVPGMANRLFGNWVDVIFSSFQSTKKYFENKEVVYVGTPIRKEMKALGASSKNPFVIFVFGGSQGAIGINSLIIEALKELKSYQDQIYWIHQTGKNDFERVKQAHLSHQTRSEVHEFIDDMSAMYQRSTLLICRAGASTIAEIASVRRAAILIPLPTAADQHQLKNAKDLTDAGAALLVHQNQMTPAKLAEQIVTLIKNPQKIDEMEAKVAQFHREGAASQLVDLLDKKNLAKSEQ